MARAQTVPPRRSGRARRWLLPAQALVLGAVAILAIASYVTLEAMIVAEATSAAQVNVAGRQRMLSQRIALMSVQLAEIDPGGSGWQVRHEELTEAIARMQREHAALIEGDPAMELPGLPSPTLVRHYLSGPSPLHESVLLYLDEARAFRDDPPEAQSPSNPHLLRLLAAVNGGLLSRLDAVVGVHQQESEQRIATLHARLRGLLVVGLLLLGCVAALLLPLSATSARESVAVEREHRLAARVMASVGHAIVVTDQANRIVEVNPAFTAITGYTREEVLGRNPSLLKSGRQDARFYQDFWARINQTGCWEGLIWNRRKSGEEYAEWLAISTVLDDEGRVEGRIAVFSDATERVRREDALREGAQTDSLTGLPNRASFKWQLSEKLAHAADQGTKVALFFIDLDGFKTINDTRGHDVGDGLLREVARRLRAATGPSDFVARLGGDEFTVLQPGVESLPLARLAAARLSEALNGTVLIAGHEVELSCSIGVALHPDTGSDQWSLLRAADLSMLEAKRSGGHTYRVTDNSGVQRAQKVDRLQRELANALENGQMRLVFQPIVTLDAGSIVGAEALVRWHHPQRGLLAAAEFVGLAEQCGLIAELSDWVLAAACREAVQWTLPGRAPLPVSVNLSNKEFVGSHLVRTVPAALAATGLAPTALQLEFHADALVERGARGRPILEALHQLGVGLVIDGYGTGALSLRDLCDLPVTGLKIDRALVAKVGSEARADALVSAIVALTKGLDLGLVAAGIETGVQADALRRLGCARGQGFSLGGLLTGPGLREVLRASVTSQAPAEQGADGGHPGENGSRRGHFEGSIVA